MKALSILYHDVIEGEDYDSSGFPGPAAARYKVSVAEFEKHLEAISLAVHSPPVTVFDLTHENRREPKVLLTFDDGGASAPRIAAMLEQRGWRGHFFITTDYVGASAFINAGQIRALREQGHVIGSHSCSHPQRMSACSPGEIFREWRQSTQVLADILGEPVTIASVPRGNHSAKVAYAAAEAGIRFLFTSEPTPRCSITDGCCILGRYVILKGMLPRSSADFAAGRFLPRFQQWAFWNAKKLVKKIGRGYYDRLREFSLRDGNQS